MKSWKNDKKTKCHWCDKIIPEDNFKLKKVRYQSVTGRVFCDDKCGREFLDSEGL
jgi:Pyruvate/2-oxoacid:ferredoxin oxidoreductase delta subunit